MSRPEVYPSANLERAVVAGLNSWGAYVHAWARRKQFWGAADGSPDKSEVECQMLVVAEIAEATEGLRAGNPPSDHIPAFTAAEEEYADAVIRIMDLSAQFGHRLGAAVIAKMRYNEGRPIKHGKAF